jgi:hypothetical protein
MSRSHAIHRDHDRLRAGAAARAGYLLRRWLPIAGAVLLAAGAALAIACLNQTEGSGKTATAERTLPPFSAVSVSGSIQARITIGDTQSVKVTADDNIVRLVSTEVDRGRLSIKTEKSYTSRAQGPMVTIVMPGLTEVETSGATNVAISGLKADELSVHTSGSSNVEAGGAADRVSIRTTGSARIRFGALSARTVEVQTSGAADVELQVSESLTGTIAGSGNIVYSGSPKVSVETSGSGRVSKK